MSGNLLSTSLVIPRQKNRGIPDKRIWGDSDTLRSEFEKKS
jgi:hypothetical protein